MTDEEIFEAVVNLNRKMICVDSSIGEHPWRFGLAITLKSRYRGKPISYLRIWNHQTGLVVGYMRNMRRRKKYNQERYTLTDNILQRTGEPSLSAPMFPICSAFKIAPFLTFKSVVRLFQNPTSLKIGLDSHLANKKYQNTILKWILLPYDTLRAIFINAKGNAIGIWIIKTLKPQIIFLFNARFPLEAGLRESIIQNSAIDLIQFDGGSLAERNYNRIQFFRDSPHNHSEIRNKIQSYWNKGEPHKREEAFEQLEALVQGFRAHGSTFVWNQNPSVLQTLEILEDSKYAVFFGSSDWETAAFKNINKQSGFESQFEACTALASALKEKGLLLLVKPHPMRKNVSQSASQREKTRWNKIERKMKNVLILPTNLTPEDMRRLILDSSFVSGYRTSMTAQSIYLRKATLILFHASWVNQENLHCVATSHEEIQAWLTRFEECLLPSTASIKESVLPWAYYSRVAGMHFDEVTFDGQNSIVDGIRVDV